MTLSPRPEGLDRHVAPAEQNLALGRYGGLDDGFDNAATGRIARQKDSPNRIVARCRQGEAKALRFRDEEAVRDLHQHSAAVTRLGVGTDGAAMIEIEQDL